MKTILLAGNPHSDKVLNRCLAHLAKSCQLEIVQDSGRFFNELSLKAFDLIIVDFERMGSSSLELIESVQYVDPGVPVILILPEAHKSLQGLARQFKAQPILRPFKPLPFLRLVDRLLHQHLNRYRRLVAALQSNLDALCQETGAVVTLLADEAGQVLVASGEVEPLSPELLPVLLNQPAEHASLTLPGRTLIPQAFGLYMTRVVEELRLALLMPPDPTPEQKTRVWCALDLVANQVKVILYQEAPTLAGTSQENRQGTAEPLPHWFTLLELRPDVPPLLDLPVQHDPEEEMADIAINWAILSNPSDLSNRLQNFCQL